MSDSVKMAIIRPIAIPVSLKFYNSQEVGMARGLSGCGVDVDIYVAGRGGAMVVREVEAEGSGRVRLFELPFLKVPGIDQALYPSLLGQLDRERYDFIQVNEENELTSFLVARHAYRRGIPVVVYQGMYRQLTGRIYAAFQSLYDRVLLPRFRHYVDLALVKTSRAGRHMEGKGFVSRKLLPVGLDPTPFALPKERNWRQELQIPEGSPILLYVGILERRRNVDFMLDLAKRLAGEGVTLVMAGSGPEEARLAGRIAAEGIANARLAGTVSQDALPSLYRASTLFLLPSNYEIYGMVVLEAMYFGVPVISTFTAGPEDIIEDGVDGRLLPLEQDLWLEAIKTLVAGGEASASMGSLAKAKVRGRLCWDAVAKVYHQEVILERVTNHVWGHGGRIGQDRKRETFSQQGF